MSQTDKLQNPIAAAVEPYRAEAVKHAKERMTEFCAKLAEELAKADGDLNVAAPRPRSTEGRFEYRRKQDRRAAFSEITVYDGERMKALGYQPHPPSYVKVDPARVEKAIEQAGQDASFSFDAYVAKLVGKVGEVVSAEVDRGSLWTGSILTVRKADGSVQRWKTTMIVNVSVLGKLFNQWPTRLLKG